MFHFLFCFFIKHISFAIINLTSSFILVNTTLHSYLILSMIIIVIIGSLFQNGIKYQLVYYSVNLLLCNMDAIISVAVSYTHLIITRTLHLFGSHQLHCQPQIIRILSPTITFCERFLLSVLLPRFIISPIQMILHYQPWTFLCIKLFI